MKTLRIAPANALFALTLILVTTGSVSAETVMGGILVSDGTDQNVQILHGDAMYVSDLYLFAGDTPVLLGNNTETGKVVDLGVFPSGTIMRIGVIVRDTGKTFMMGPGSENDDALAHATTTVQADGSILVGFEDTFNGGDRDYNDINFLFTGSQQKLPPYFPTAPTATPDKPTSHEDVAFTAAAVSPDGLPLTYTWKFGDGATADAPIAAHRYSTPGKYTALIIADDGTGGVGSARVIVEVQPDPANQNPTIVSGPIVTPVPALLNAAVEFFAAGSDPENDPLTYTWNFGDGVTDTGPTPAHTYTATGYYTATVTIDDGNGGHDMASVQVAVAQDFAIAKMSVALNFAKPGRDGYSITGSFQLPPKTPLANLNVTLDLAGVSRQFTLSSRGAGKGTGASIRVVSDKKVAGKQKFSLKLKKAELAGSLAPMGMVNATLKNQAVSIPVTLTVGEMLFWHLQPQKYTARQGKTGRSK